MTKDSVAQSFGPNSTNPFFSNNFGKLYHVIQLIKAKSSATWLFVLDRLITGKSSVADLDVAQRLPNIYTVHVGGNASGNTTLQYIRQHNVKCMIIPYSMMDDLRNDMQYSTLYAS